MMSLNKLQLFSFLYTSPNKTMKLPFSAEICLNETKILYKLFDGGYMLLFLVILGTLVRIKREINVTSPVYPPIVYQFCPFLSF
jgi:hypothetical protein